MHKSSDRFFYQDSGKTTHSAEENDTSYKRAAFFLEMKQKKSKWPPQNNLIFQLPQFSIFFMKFPWIVPWVSIIDWWEGHWFGSNYMVVRLSEIWGIIFFCTMDGFFRILEKRLSELICTRLYLSRCKVRQWENYRNYFIDYLDYMAFGSYMFVGKLQKTNLRHLIFVDNSIVFCRPPTA